MKYVDQTLFLYVNRLAVVANSLDWDLEQYVYPTVRWLVFHRRAKIVDTVHRGLKTMFALAPKLPKPYVFLYFQKNCHTNALCSLLERRHLPDIIRSLISPRTSVVYRPAANVDPCHPYRNTVYIANATRAHHVIARASNAVQD